MTWPPHLYRRVANEKGIPNDIVRTSLDQAENVQASLGLPAILSLKHLSLLVGTDYRNLRKIVERRHTQPYRFFKVRKRLGGYRLICVPSNNLLRAQRWIARRILRNVPAHPASMAYGRGQSAFACARLHCACRWLIKMDVRQFFESITEKQVYHVFRSLGYRELVSFELARLCTRTVSPSHDKSSLKRWTNEKALSYSITPYQNTALGHLPQGAPTSPALSNLAVHGLDGRIAAIAGNMNLVYTRYADDIIMSSDAPSFSREKAEQIVEEVGRVIRSGGLRLHTVKTSIAPPGARKVVLGLLVDRDRPRLTRTYRMRLEQHVYYLAKFGPVQHAASRGFKSIFALRAHLQGLLIYAKYVDPEFANPLIVEFEKVEWPFQV